MAANRPRIATKSKRTSARPSGSATSTRYREIVRERIEEIAIEHKLSPREREVFVLLLYGLMADQIADRLGVSARTVKFHQTNVLDKLDADSRLDLFRLFFSPE